MFFKSVFILTKLSADIFGQIHPPYSFQNQNLTMSLCLKWLLTAAFQDLLIIWDLFSPTVQSVLGFHLALLKYWIAGSSTLLLPSPEHTVLFLPPCLCFAGSFSPAYCCLASFLPHLRPQATFRSRVESQLRHQCLLVVFSDFSILHTVSIVPCTSPYLCTFLIVVDYNTLLS